MADKSMNTYLNDHLAGAMVGTNLAEQIRSRNQGTALGELMASLAPQIEEDRQTLVELMHRIDASKNPVKQAGAWITEKASRAKFWGLTSVEPQLGTFLALESLALGVLGKLSLWRALAQVADRYPAIASVDLANLIDRAQTQHDLLERERLAAGRKVLSHTNAPA